MIGKKIKGKIYSGINRIPRIARTLSSKSVELMGRNILEEHSITIKCTNTEGKCAKSVFVQPNCTNKYLKESKLNSDLNLSTCKHKSGQDSGGKIQIPTGCESKRSHLAPKQCFFPLISLEKNELIKLVDSGNLLDQKKVPLQNPCSGKVETEGMYDRIEHPAQAANPLTASSRNKYEPTQF